MDINKSPAHVNGYDFVHPDLCDIRQGSLEKSSSTYWNSGESHECCSSGDKSKRDEHSDVYTAS